MNFRETPSTKSSSILYKYLYKSTVHVPDKELFNFNLVLLFWLRSPMNVRRIFNKSSIKNSTFITTIYSQQVKLGYCRSHETAGLIISSMNNRWTSPIQGVTGSHLNFHSKHSPTSDNCCQSCQDTMYPIYSKSTKYSNHKSPIYNVQYIFLNRKSNHLLYQQVELASL